MSTDPVEIHDPVTCSWDFNSMSGHVVAFSVDHPRLVEGNWHPTDNDMSISFGLVCRNAISLNKENSMYVLIPIMEPGFEGVCWILSNPILSSIGLRLRIATEAETNAIRQAIRRGEAFLLLDSVSGLGFASSPYRHRCASQTQGPCSVPGCPNTSRFRGLCATHLHREKRGLPMLAPIGSLRRQQSSSQPRSCSVPGCNRSIRGGNKGLCSAHWYRLNKGISFDIPIRKYQRRDKQVQPDHPTMGDIPPENPKFRLGQSVAVDSGGSGTVVGITALHSYNENDTDKGFLYLIETGPGEEIDSFPESDLHAADSQS